jgi:hypothetical protein
VNIVESEIPFVDMEERENVAIESSHILMDKCLGQLQRNWENEKNE